MIGASNLAVSPPTKHTHGTCIDLEALQDSSISPSHPPHCHIHREHCSSNDTYNQPLQQGSIPDTVQVLQLGSGFVHLNVGGSFNHPLLPGVLRELLIHFDFSHPMQPDSLPEGLEVLAFDSRTSYPHSWQPGVIQRDRVRIVAGGIPATVRWLQLPATYVRRV